MSLPRYGFRLWLLLCAVLTASAIAPDDFQAQTAGLNAGGRVQVQVPSSPDYYYLLLRGPRPDACSFPADMQLHGMLTDCQPAGRRAFFQVKRVPVE